MKKSIVTLLATISVIVLIVMNCSKKSSDNNSGTKVSKISGTVTGQVTPAGAIVALSTQPNATKVIDRVVADSTGKYSFSGLSDGTYYLSGKYNTDNANLKSSGITFTTDGDVTVAVSGADVTQDIALVSNGSTGTDIIEYAATGKWNLDETHSRVGFEFPFDSVNATFNGHFTNFGINSFLFNQATPSSSHMDIWVDITSAETGAPTSIDTVHKTAVGGRDGLNGCISHTFGVVYALADTFFKGYYRPTSVIVSGNLVTSAKASFVSTSVSAYGDGYVANGNLTFHGITKAVSLYFHYIKGYAVTANGKTTNYSSFSGFFDMKAKVDFGVISTHVKGNPVHVITNLQFNK